MSETEPPEEKSDCPEPPPPNAGNTGGPSAPKQEKISYHNIEKAKQFWRLWVVRPIVYIVRWPEKHDGVVTAAATVAIAILTWSLSQDSGRQANTANDQFRIMKGQLDAMEANRRPWVSVEVTGAGPIQFTKPLTAWVQFSITLKNVGHSPTMNVTGDFEIHTVQESKIFSYTTDEKRICAAARKTADDAYSHSLPGFFLFPDQQTPKHGAGGRVEQDDFAKSWLGPHRVTFTIVGCVDYTFADDPKKHGQTGFAYTLTKHPVGGIRKDVFDPDDGDIPPDKILVQQEGFGGGYIQ